MGLARAIGAVGFAFIVGLVMHGLFIKEERSKARESEGFNIGDTEEPRPLLGNAAYFACMVAVLVFANWGKPASGMGAWAAIYHAKWVITACLLALPGTHDPQVVHQERGPRVDIDDVGTCAADPAPSVRRGADVGTPARAARA